MAVTTTPIDVGSSPGDGTGDPARTGGQTINTNTSNLDAAVEELQSGKYEVDNTSSTLAKGERHLCTSHAGITKTLPAVTGSLSTTDFNAIWVINADSNNNVTIDPDGTDELYLNGAGQGAGNTVTLEPGQMAIILDHAASSAWDVLRIPIGDLDTGDLTDFNLSSLTDEDILWYDSGTSKWLNVSKEDADIVDRLVPALETTPYLKHETRSARSSGTETINCEDDPSVRLPIGGNNVTISLAVPSLSLPVRGLSAVKLSGKVFIEMNGNYTGLTVTTTAGDKISPFPKGTAPSTSAEDAVLVWEWYDDGTTDHMWAEWINDY